MRRFLLATLGLFALAIVSFGQNPSTTATRYFDMTTNQNWYKIENTGWDSGFLYRHYTSHRFNTSSGEVFSIIKNGNIGIGATSPDYKLDIQGDNAILRLANLYTGATGGGRWLRIQDRRTSTGSSNQFSSGIDFYDFNGEAFKIALEHNAYFGNTNKLTFTANGTNQIMTLKENGNVGIGTDSPSDPLHVNGIIRASNRIIAGVIDNRYTYGALTTGGSIVIGNGASYGLIRGDNYHKGHGGAIKIMSSNTASNQYLQIGYNASGSADNFTPTATFLANGKVGIGTTSPAVRAHISTNTPRTSSNEVVATFISTDDSDSYRYGLATSIIGGATSADRKVLLSATHYNYADGTFSGTASGLCFSSGNIGIGTTDPGIYKLAVNGTIACTELKVLDAATAGWPDYVFEENYKLRTLAEVENHIKTNGHLPGVPSAAQVEEEGYSMAEMDATLLQKIEELTLYTIEQEKIIKKQDSRLKMQDSRLQELEKQNAEIERLSNENNELKQMKSELQELKEIINALNK